MVLAAVVVDDEEVEPAIRAEVGVERELSGPILATFCFLPVYEVDHEDVARSPSRVYAWIVGLAEVLRPALVVRREEALVE